MAKQRILIVDDDTALAGTIRTGLEQTGPYEVVTEDDPRQARRRALDFKPDLILMDVIMPWMDGGTVAAQIREEDSLKQVPVIFLTSILSKDEAREKGSRIGNDPVLAKPVSLGELIQAIRKVLGR